MGDPCDALLALSLRGYGDDLPSAQLLRIFDDGHRMEPMVVEALKAAGLDVSELDPHTGKQHHVNLYGGHFAANLDGKVILRSPDGKAQRVVSLEIKSMNRAMFERFRTNGIEVSHPDYYAQVQTGMGMAGLGACLLVARCKDNAIYHAELVPFSEEAYRRITARVARVMFEKVPKGIDSWGCTQCSKQTACRLGISNTDETHCRQCRHAMPDITRPGKTWLCTLHNKADTQVPCSDWQTIRIERINQSPIKKPKP